MFQAIIARHSGRFRQAETSYSRDWYAALRPTGQRMAASESSPGANKRASGMFANLGIARRLHTRHCIPVSPNHYFLYSVGPSRKARHHKID